MRFRLGHDCPKPAGDQAGAINSLTRGLRDGKEHSTLMGITGSGKTRTIAGVIHRVQHPALVLCPNKVLAFQTFTKVRGYMPSNAVHLYMSDYDFFKPESYRLAKDKYREKKASLDPEITRHRMATVVSLLTRPDVVIVGTVSALYPIGAPDDHREYLIHLARKQKMELDELRDKLTDSRHVSADKLEPGKFRVRGSCLEVFPSSEESPYRIEFKGNVIKQISTMDANNGQIIGSRRELIIPPAYIFFLPQSKVQPAVQAIRKERNRRLRQLKSQDGDAETQLLRTRRLKSRVDHDVEMLQRFGHCRDMDNYSLHLSGRTAGTPPDTLLSYFPDDFLVFADESHLTLTQIRGMSASDKSRKQELIEAGFLLPSALEYRPLTFEEFEERCPQMIHVSATPGLYEIEKSGGDVVRQVIRPTGLLDPEVDVLPKCDQLEDLEIEIRGRVDAGERVIVIAITKRGAKSTAEHLAEAGFEAEYVHSGLTMKQRKDVLARFKQDDGFHVLVGVNMLREGLDFPRVSLVAILDADRGGFLRSETALLQMVGRAARNSRGKAILFADTITPAMYKAISATENRRKLQQAHNRKHRIRPRTIRG